jgi:23S rRNA pseudouridine1911/1915/1917 synthase
MALEQNSLTEADSISAGVSLPDGEFWDDQAEQRRCEVPAALHGARICSS